MTAGRRVGLIAALDTADPARAAAWAGALAPHLGMVEARAGILPRQRRARAARDRRRRARIADLPRSQAARHSRDRRGRGPRGAAARAALPHPARRRRDGDARGGARGRGDSRRGAAPAPRGDRAHQPRRCGARRDRRAGRRGTQVERLARLALAAGADGLVCSPREVGMLRAALGPAPVLVVPGIRPEGGGAGDQARTMTPAQAVAAGADWIVVGRPITRPADPAAAAAAIAARSRLASARDAGQDLRPERSGQGSPPPSMPARIGWGSCSSRPPRARSPPPRPPLCRATRPGGPGRVGLFVDPTDSDIAAVLDAVQLDALQLYTDAARAAAIGARFGLPVWRAVGVATPADLPDRGRGADGFVIEAKPPAAPRGRAATRSRSTGRSPPAGARPRPGSWPAG